MTDPVARAVDHAPLQRDVEEARKWRASRTHWNPTQPSEFDLVAVATRLGCFNTFLAAAASIGLAETLKGAGPYTLFAPTDEAFLRLPGGVLPRLMQSEHAGLLAAILTHHVLLGQAMSDSLSGRLAISFGGRKLGFDDLDGGVRVNGARIVHPDLQAANGVLHGIDRVLWPERAAASVA